MKHVEDHLRFSDQYPIVISKNEYLAKIETPRWNQKGANWEKFTEKPQKILEINEKPSTEYMMREINKS